MSKRMTAYWWDKDKNAVAIMSLADVCWNISSVFIVITLGVIAILCVLMLLGVFVCIFDHDDKNDKSSKE